MKNKEVLARYFTLKMEDELELELTDEELYQVDEEKKMPIKEQVNEIRYGCDDDLIGEMTLGYRENMSDVVSSLIANAKISVVNEYTDGTREELGVFTVE